MCEVGVGNLGVVEIDLYPPSCRGEQNAATKFQNVNVNGQRSRPAPNVGSISVVDGDDQWKGSCPRSFRAINSRCRSSGQGGTA